MFRNRRLCSFQPEKVLVPLLMQGVQPDDADVPVHIAAVGLEPVTYGCSAAAARFCHIKGLRRTDGVTHRSATDYLPPLVVKVSRGTELPPPGDCYDVEGTVTVGPVGLRRQLRTTLTITRFTPHVAAPQPAPAALPPTGAATPGGAAAGGQLEKEFVDLGTTEKSASVEDRELVEV